MSATLAIVPDISNKGLIETIDVTTGITSEATAKERRELVEDLRIAIQNVNQYKIEAGHLLTVLRDGTPYGYWEPLLELLCTDMKFARATAHRYMQLYAETQFLPSAVVEACQQHGVDLSKQPVLSAVKQAVAAQPEASPETIVAQIQQAASQRQVDATKPIASICPDCGESLPSKNQLRKHGRKVHNIPGTAIADFLRKSRPHSPAEPESPMSAEQQPPTPAATPKPANNPEVIAAVQAHEAAAQDLRNLVKESGIDADVSRSTTNEKFHVIWHDVTAEQIQKFAEAFKA